jgi:arginase
MPTKTIELILVPYDVERADTAAAQAPRALLARGFADRLRDFGGEVHVSEVPLRTEQQDKAGKVAELGRAIARTVAIASSRGRFPLVVSGGCLHAVGVVTGLQRSGRQLEVVWIDAHGDFNTPESTPSGNWDGMALAAVCGRSLPEVYKAVELRPIHFRNVIHLAGRAFDPPEIEDIRRLRLDVIPPDRIGSEEVRRRIAEIAGLKDLYLHVDVDGIDPQDAPAVNFPEPGGPRFAEVAALLATIARHRAPAAMTLASLNFERSDEDGKARTLAACTELVGEFFRDDAAH